MSPTPEIETARAWLDDASNDVVNAQITHEEATIELEAAKARRARIIAALKALGDEIEAEVPPVAPTPMAPSLQEIMHRFWPDRITAPAPVDEDPVADEMPVAWPV